MTRFNGPVGALTGNKPMFDKVTFTWLAEWLVPIPPTAEARVTVLAGLVGRQSVQ
ncbi:hypothetical protein ACWT_4119 [Actinoplanes sp. SE50]|nr:hypothetical protein [Actinoplanes sp. SE50]AEV85143.1 hypothetical protein ACPL_4248 [Actinoplanes sp. SE50/110]ATO83534.1 hypothetical protein ACWT_4119 [Actinoplanes sp. SE50]SLM00941.1 hypothetical protein ACSP50_4174 [Actinoplanes sp. SE50/110]